jgi:hypothetical protein
VWRGIEKGKIEEAVLFWTTRVLSEFFGYLQSEDLKRPSLRV